MNQKTDKDDLMRILYIARYYPPIISGAARRQGELVSALREILQAPEQVFVLAPDYGDNDNNGLAIPHPNPIPQANGPPGLRKSARDHARDWLFWPDADIRWARRAAHVFLKKSTFAPDWVISSSPPESAHIAGKMIASQTKAKWAAEFRDLWLKRPLNPLRQNPIRRFGEKQIARRLCKKADLLIGTDSVICEELRSFADRDEILHLPHFAKKMPANLTTGRQYFDRTHINLVHTGSFSASDPDRKIEPLLDGFGEAVSSDSQLRLHLVGRQSEQETNKINGLEKNIRNKIILHGILPRNEALALQSEADALILVGGMHSDVPPGKCSEYLAQEKPIIAIGPQRWRNFFHPAEISTAQLMRACANRRTNRHSGFDLKLARPPTPIETATKLVERLSTL